MPDTSPPRDRARGFQSSSLGTLRVVAVSVIGSYTLQLVARAIGLLRDSLTARYLGATAEADAFFIGSWLPFFVINVVNVAITPLLIAELTGIAEDWAERARRLFFTLAAILLLPIVLLAVAGRSLIEFTSPLLSNEAVTASYYVLLVTSVMAYVSCLNYLLAAAANSRHFFVIPRLLDILLPLGACAGILLLFPSMGIVGIAVGMLAAAALAHAGYRMLSLVLGASLKPWIPSVGAVLSTITRALPYVGGCVLINATFLVLIRTMSSLGDGSVTILMLSDRMWNVVSGGVVAGILVAMPRLVESKRRLREDGFHIIKALLFGIGCIFTIANGFILIAGRSLIRFLFERGLFTAESGADLSGAVFWYGFSAALMAIGYALEYYMIAGGMTRRAFWGGACQFLSFLLLIVVVPHLSLEIGSVVLIVYVLANVARCSVLIFLLREHLSGGVRPVIKETVLFGSLTVSYFVALHGFGAAAGVDGYSMESFGAAVSVWIASTLGYLYLLTIMRVEGVSQGTKLALNVIWGRGRAL